MSHSVLIVNGPNLNMLGTREPEIYGSETLADIEAKCRAHAGDIGIDVSFYQSNSEGELVSRIQQAKDEGVGIIINAGAYTHTSIAIRDALSLLDQPIIEVHLSNICAREEFRHTSYISGLAKAVICGLGTEGYIVALTAMKRFLGN